jgi:translation initiation factor IF-2
MTDQRKIVRLSKAAKEFNIGRDTIIDFLLDKGFEIDSNPNTKLTPDMYSALLEEFQEEKHVREIAQQKELEYLGKGTITIEDKKVEKTEPTDDVDDFEPADELIIKNVGVDYSTKEKSPKKKVADEIKEKTKTDTGKKEEEAEAEAEKTDKKEEPGGIKVLDKIDLDSLNQKTRPKKKTKEEKEKEKEAKATKKKPKSKTEEETKAAESKKEEPKEEIETPPKKDEEKKPEKEIEKEEDNFIPTKFEKLSGPTVVDKIELPKEVSKTKKEKKPVASSDDKPSQKKKKRRRIKTQPEQKQEEKREPRKKPFTKKKEAKPEPTEEEIQQRIKETLARLAPSGKSKSSKYRRQKRESVSQSMQDEMDRQEQEKSVLKVTEFLTANELAIMMNVSVNEIIKSCMQLGLFVSINQRLDAETIVLVAEEFGYQVDFVSVDDSENLEVEETEDDPKDLVERAPIVTVMGHVDHGKTKLLDYIRKANVVAGEAGGITQHIGAYEVTSESGKKVTFLDTPGHEAFTAMRARGAKVTDIAIIVIAADDSVMPQTKEAINHAQAAGVPIVFAFNKMDKPGANSDKIKEQLSAMNILVEDWGGKFQSQEISAITGMGISDLLEKVLLEAEILELKANPNKPAKGTVIEATLDKGRGYVTTILVQDGSLKQGDIILAGPVSGRVKAMFNERNTKINDAGPSSPVVLLGLNAAAQAGDVFNVMTDEKEARSLATKRQQLIREQSQRTQKHITLDEIGRRIAIGDFKELNIIVKGDVDGSVEALSDEILKLSSDEVQVNVIHKAVGAITESDVILASASDAIIIGFQVRPVPQARKAAEKEQIDIRLYSVIYKATEELKAAVEGMLAPKMEEKITCNIEVREVFKITKVGTIAGCYVLDGKINRNTSVRLIRDGIVVYTGKLGSLKRFKDDVKEVSAGYECGLNIENFNDIKVGDIVEGYEEVEVR